MNWWCNPEKPEPGLAAAGREGNVRDGIGAVNCGGGMRAFLIAVTTLALTLPAFGQSANKKTEEEIKMDKARQADIEKAYRLSADRIPEKGAADPWGNMRGVETPQNKPKKPAGVK